MHRHLQAHMPDKLALAKFALAVEEHPTSVGTSRLKISSIQDANYVQSTRLQGYHPVVPFAPVSSMLHEIHRHSALCNMMSAFRTCLPVDGAHLSVICS